MEATSTRRAGLERFTFPQGWKPYFVIDLANESPGRGTYFSVSFGPWMYHYQALACYDRLNNGAQKLSEYGIWTGNE